MCYFLGEVELVFFKDVILWLSQLYIRVGFILKVSWVIEI